MLCRKFAVEGDNPVDTPRIYNVEESNRLLLGVQPLTPGGREMCYKSGFFPDRFRNYNCYTRVVSI